VIITTISRAIVYFLAGILAGVLLGFIFLVPKASANYHWTNWSQCQARPFYQGLWQKRTCTSYSGTEHCYQWGQTEWLYCTPPPVYHSTCVELACIQVLGEGQNTCETDKDCVPAIPTPTPTPEIPAPQPCNGCGQTMNPPACPNSNIAFVPTNFHVLRKADVAILKWVPTGGNLVNVYYKELGAPAWQFGLGDQLNDGYLQIDHLNPRMGYGFAVEQHDGCGGGAMSPKAVVIDPPTTTWVLFPLSHWAW
jgi:hypothetical protein